MHYPLRQHHEILLAKVLSPLTTYRGLRDVLCRKNITKNPLPPHFYEKIQQKFAKEQNIFLRFLRNQIFLVLALEFLKKKKKRKKKIAKSDFGCFALSFQKNHLKEERGNGFIIISMQRFLQSSSFKVCKIL